MSGDHMQRFITALMKWGVGLALGLAALLLLLGTALICRSEILRYGAAVLCFTGGAWILVSLVIAVCKRK